MLEEVGGKHWGSKPYCVVEEEALVNCGPWDARAKLTCFLAMALRELMGKIEFWSVSCFF